MSRRKITHHGNWSVYEYDGDETRHDAGSLRFLDMLAQALDVRAETFVHPTKYLYQTQVFQLDDRDFYWPWGSPIGWQWWKVGPTTTVCNAWDAWIAGTIAEFRANLANPPHYETIDRGES